MAGERVVSNAIKALRPFRNNVDNMFAFEEEVKVTLNSLYEKHRQGQTSIERARQSLIQVSPLLEREIKIWCKMIYRRLSTRTRARNAWRVQLKRAMPMEVFIFILQAVKNARSAYGVSYKEEKLIDTITYDRENRVLRDFSQMSQLSRDSVQAFFSKKSKGARKGTMQVVISSETPFTISFLKRTQQVMSSLHYKFINEFGYTFSSV